MDFKLVSDYKPMGDQPEAIERLVQCVEDGVPYSTLYGVTGSGKTFTVANVIAKLNRPVLVLSHNKTLAAQLYSEFRSLFPDNAVEYFVSYYDYYQPEAYIPSTDTYIEKDLAINAEIDRMRLSATQALLSGRRDVIVVSSVSCIYGIGNPADFHNTVVKLAVGDVITTKHLMYRLVEILYTRTAKELEPSTFRITGDTIDICSSIGNNCYRILFFDNEIEAIHLINPDTGQRIDSLQEVNIYPANIFVPNKARIESAIGQIETDLEKQVAFFEREGREMEAQRIRQCVEYDLEMIKELGYCSGIENYSRYFDGRMPGARPFCLLDYFPDDYLLIVDESHVTLPQVRGMYGGDSSRKENLVEYGFRLPAARDNRPLRFEEFEQLQGSTIYVSATPSNYEISRSEANIVEQFIRPTGIIDPPLSVRISKNHISDLLEDIDACVARDERMIVTTITKRLAEDMSQYLEKIGIRSRYIHSDLDTMERVQILEDLRNGLFDVLVGVNLLREGIDLPEVSHIAIFDADKEGILRNQRSLIQMAGRAARHANGKVVLYGTHFSESMRLAIEESNRHRQHQIRYNVANGLMPRQIKRNTQAPNILISTSEEERQKYPFAPSETMLMAADTKVEYNSEAENIDLLIKRARENMEKAAKALDFTTAKHYRDQMYHFEKVKQENNLNK